MLKLIGEDTTIMGAFRVMLIIMRYSKVNELRR